MERYRAFAVGPDGRYVRFFDLDCDDDEQAVYVASLLRLGMPIEIWKGGAFIGRVEGLGGVVFDPIAAPAPDDEAGHAVGPEDADDSEPPPG